MNPENKLPEQQRRGRISRIISGVAAVALGLGVVISSEAFLQQQLSDQMAVADPTPTEQAVPAERHLTGQQASLAIVEIGGLGVLTLAATGYALSGEQDRQPQQ